MTVVTVLLSVKLAAKKCYGILLVCFIRNLATRLRDGTSRVPASLLDTWKRLWSDKGNKICGKPWTESRYSLANKEETCFQIDCFSS